MTFRLSATVIVVSHSEHLLCQLYLSIAVYDTADRVAPVSIKP